MKENRFHLVVDVRSRRVLNIHLNKVSVFGYWSVLKYHLHWHLEPTGQCFRLPFKIAVLRFGFARDGTVVESWVNALIFVVIETVFLCKNAMLEKVGGAIIVNFKVMEELEVL